MFKCRDCGRIVRNLVPEISVLYDSDGGKHCTRCVKYEYRDGIPAVTDLESGVLEEVERAEPSWG